MLRCGPAEMVETDVKPPIAIRVNLEILVANLPRCQSLLDGLVFRGSTVLVCAADEQRVVTAETAKPEKQKCIRVSDVFLGVINFLGITYLKLFSIH